MSARKSAKSRRDEYKELPNPIAWYPLTGQPLTEVHLKEWAAISRVTGKFCRWWHQLCVEAESRGYQIGPELPEIAMLFDRLFPGTSNRFRQLDGRPYVQERQLLDYLFDRHSMPPAQAGNLTFGSLLEILRADFEQQRAKSRTKSERVGLRARIVELQAANRADRATRDAISEMQAATDDVGRKFLFATQSKSVSRRRDKSDTVISPRKRIPRLRALVKSLEDHGWSKRLDDVPNCAGVVLLIAVRNGVSDEELIKLCTDDAISQLSSFVKPLLAELVLGPPLEATTATPVPAARPQTEHSDDASRAAGEYKPTPTNHASVALLRVFTNGLSDDRITKASQLLTDDERTANDKLGAIDRLLPFPATASAEQLGELLGVSKQAILKTKWWNEKRKGEKANEIGRRQARHQTRAEEIEAPDLRNDGD